MCNYEHSGDQNLRSIPRFEKPNIHFSRTPNQFLRRPFPQLRRRMMSGRYSNVGFRPVGQSTFRPDCPNAPIRVPDFRYPALPNSPVIMAPPIVERLPFPNTVPNNPFENKNQQYLPPRPALLSCPNNQTVAECSERKSAMHELNSFCDLWVEALAPNGRKYYYNARTRLTSWERPMHVRIIDLNEIKRLQESSGSELIQNFPNENPKHFVPQQPFNSYGPTFYPRNFPIPPRLMVLPPPHNIYNPPQIYPVPSTELVSQDSSFYKFNPMIPPSVFAVPIVNENIISNNANSDHTLSIASTEENNDSHQTVSSVVSDNENNNIKMSDWTASDNSVPELTHTNTNQENICNDAKSAMQEIFPGTECPKLENNTQIFKFEEPFLCETEHSGKFSPAETDRLPSEQLKSLSVSSTHITGTNWYVISTKDKKTFFFDSVRKLSVWEKPNELKNVNELNKQVNVPMVCKPDAVKENGLLESDNCISKISDQDSKPEEPQTNVSECFSTDQKVDIKKDEKVDLSRPVSSTPVSGTTWFVVWTGDERVFYFDSQRKISVWERPNELKNRGDVDKLIEKSPLSQDLKALKKDVRKIDTNEQDSIKKLKKEDEKEVIDLNVNEKSENIEKKESFQNSSIPHGERVKIFSEMLAEKKVSAFSTWEKELYKIVFDSRYLLLPSKERKQVFESYISKKIEEEKNYRRKELHHQREKFISLLKEASVTSKSRFSDFAQRYAKDERFKAIEKIKQKEGIFNQYISDLLNKEKELESLKTERKKKFFELLKEQKFEDKEITWPNVQAKISDDERYKAIHSNSSREKWFNEFVKGLSSNSIPKEKEERIHASLRNREEEVKRDLSVHMKDRERERDFHNHMSAVSNFKALLNDLIKTSDITWHSAKKILKEDHRWKFSHCLESEDREDLFEHHIDLLNSKKKEQFYRLLDEIPQITLKTSWLEVRKSVLNDPRFSKFSSSERKCEEVFKEYLKKKVKDAKIDFKKLLQETKMITYKSKSLLENSNHLKDIEEILSQDKRYLNLECIRGERKEMLLSYIDKLHEGGPPPPPTASDALNRLKSK